MLNELKAAPLLDAFRGSVKSDRAALAQLIAQVSQLAAQRKDDVSEIEVNPVLVHPEGEGITIVDALVIGRDKPAGPTQDRY
jgi:acetyltransferase